MAVLTSNFLTSKPYKMERFFLVSYQFTMTGGFGFGEILSITTDGNFISRTATLKEVSEGCTRVVITSIFEFKSKKDFEDFQK